MAHNIFHKVGGLFQRTSPIPWIRQAQARELPPETYTQRSDLQGADYFRNVLQQGTPVEQKAAQGWLDRNRQPTTSPFVSNSSPLSPQTTTPGINSNPPSVTPGSTPPQTQTYQPQPQPQQQQPQGGVISPYDAFNLLLQDSLKQAQGIDNSELLKQQRLLQRESIRRSRGEGVRATEEELKFLSPTQQANIRGAQVGALSPDLDEIAFQITKANQDRENLLEQIEFARKSGNEVLERQYKAEDRVLDKRVKELGMKKTDAEINEIYAKTAKTFSEITTSGGNVNSETIAGINLVNSLLQNPDARRITGVLQGKIGGQLLGGGTTGLAKNQYNQLVAKLSLGARQLLKGSGAISDFESKVLRDSTSAIKRNLPDEQFLYQLKQIRGALTSNAGLPVVITLTNPNTGKKTEPFQTTRDGLSQAIADGLIIEYQ